VIDAWARVDREGLCAAVAADIEQGMMLLN
jgi:hypothetical protein